IAGDEPGALAVGQGDAVNGRLGAEAGVGRIRVRLECRARDVHLHELRPLAGVTLKSGSRPSVSPSHHDIRTALHFSIGEPSSSGPGQPQPRLDLRWVKSRTAGGPAREPPGKHGLLTVLLVRLPGRTGGDQGRV